MIKYQTDSNLLEADAEALVNTVNCVGVMGKGIALQFKQAFPRNYREYAAACKRGDVRPGVMLVVPTNALSGPRFIINFPTKRHWRGKSRIEDIDSGLVALRSEVKRLGIQSIAVPPLGCGNGGLEWSDVRPRIERALGDLPEVQVLLYPPADAPAAASMPVGTQRPELTRARALLLKLLDAYGEPGYRLTLLEVQKIAYFLQMAGEPLRLNYVKHLYGPYADNLNHVLQRLEGHYLRGYGDRSVRAEIHLLAGASSEAARYLQGAESADQRLRLVADLIDGFETPYAMELLATVHWVATHDPDAADDPDVAIAATHRWNDRKRRLMTARHIRTAWEHLKRLGWFDRAGAVTA